MTLILIKLLLAQAGATSVPGVQLQNGGTSQGQVTKLNCTGAGVTCSKTGAVGTINVTGGGSGGSGAPVDAGYVFWGTNTTGSTNERGLADGTNTTVNTGTPGVISLDVSGTLPISVGGTNSTATPTAGGVNYGTGTAHAFTAAGTASQCLISGGAGAPTWGSCSTGGGGSNTAAGTISFFDGTGGFTTGFIPATWVTASSVAVCYVLYSTTLGDVNNTAQVAALTQMGISAGPIDAGVGIWVNAYQTVGASGSFAVACTGA